jgi:two-component system, NarL family, sensor histidine kinase UhpB
MVDLTIYRTIQEALTNVFRHANATHVNVTVERAGVATASGNGGARVRVTDDGCGMKADHRLGLGLTGMRERILALGGSLTVDSRGNGVTVEALIPKGAAC